MNAIIIIYKRNALDLIEWFRFRLCVLSPKGKWKEIWSYGVYFVLSSCVTCVISAIISTIFFLIHLFVCFVWVSSISNMYTILNLQSFINTHILNLNSLQFFCFRLFCVFLKKGLSISNVLWLYKCMLFIYCLAGWWSMVMQTQCSYCFWTIDPFSASEPVKPWAAAVIINEAEKERAREEERKK